MADYDQSIEAVRQKFEPRIRGLLENLVRDFCTQWSRHALILDDGHVVTAHAPTRSDCAAVLLPDGRLALSRFLDSAAMAEREREGFDAAGERLPLDAVLVEGARACLPGSSEAGRR